jgi:hypothetical protein
MRAMFAVLALMLCLPATGQAQSWTEFRPKDAGFRIEMPGEPKVDTKKEKGKLGLTSAVASVGKNKAFVVNFRDKDDDLKIDLDTMLDAVVQGQADGKKVISVKKEKLGGYPARRVRLKDSDDDEYEARVVIADKRLIQAIFVGPDGDSLGRRFLDSFVILEP